MCLTRVNHVLAESHSDKLREVGTNYEGFTICKIKDDEQSMFGVILIEANSSKCLSRINDQTLVSAFFS